MFTTRCFQDVGADTDSLTVAFRASGRRARRAGFILTEIMPGQTALPRDLTATRGRSSAPTRLHRGWSRPGYRIISSSEPTRFQNWCVRVCLAGNVLPWLGTSMESNPLAAMMGFQ